ncbi:unnamed protein product [Dovyalis caffra]|uniref:Uncharacterized protein n=1 Tax=Dovyalis caffra TaxID=77055 RepID=A0AAV1RXS6_9ROSI|nr:unnamed protein product [Dovyalis caffra]
MIKKKLLGSHGWSSDLSGLEEIELPTSTSSDGGSTIRTNPCDGQMSHLKEKKSK